MAKKVTVVKRKKKGEPPKGLMAIGIMPARPGMRPGMAPGGPQGRARRRRSGY